VDSEFSRKKLLVFGTLLLVVLAIPVTLYTALNLNNKSQTKSQAADVTEATVIVAINGEQIKKSDIRKVAEEQNDPSSVDQQALIDALETITERKILDKAASDLGITPEQARLTKFEDDGLSEMEAKYEALREQIILKSVNSTELITIGFWNPPSAGVTSLSVDEQTAAADELAAGIPALDEIEGKMSDGDDPLDIADAILIDNPDLKNVLALNGYILDPLDQVDREFASQPIIEEYGDTALDAQSRDAIFNTSKNGVKKISNTSENRGGMVIKVINKGNINGSSSYDAWLTEQKASSVEPVNAL